MSRKHTSKKSNRGKSHQTAGHTNWSSVHELAHTLDSIIRQSAGSLLKIKEDDQVGARITAEHNDLMMTLTASIVDIKAGVKAAVDGMPINPKEVVSEDDYPSYLERFVQLSGLHERLMAEVVPPLGDITMTVGDLIEKDKENAK